MVKLSTCMEQKQKHNTSENQNLPDIESLVPLKLHQLICFDRSRIVSTRSFLIVAAPIAGKKRDREGIPISLSDAKDNIES